MISERDCDEEGRTSVGIALESRMREVNEDYIWWLALAAESAECFKYKKENVVVITFVDFEPMERFENRWDMRCDDI